MARLVIAIVALLLVAAPLASDGQPTARVARIGVLTHGLAPTAPPVEVFRQALREHGYVEGQHYTLEFRFAQGRADRLPALAGELVRLHVDLIITEGNAAALAAKQATTTIPIVMAVAGDPVRAGVVASLARPGGNVTGLTLIHPELNGKRLHLLTEAVPRLGLVAVLWNPDNPAGADYFRETEIAARSLGVQMQGIEVRNPGELQAGFKAAAGAQAGGLVVIGDGMLWSQRARIVEFVLASRLPAMFPEPDYPELGGLMSYGPSLDDSIRRAATLVDRVLKGAKPADLPIEQPTRFELIVNLKTARALGLTLPQSLLLRADRLIE
jgi:ABC-type uncharacterized transport system substrate-binding protein